MLGDGRQTDAGTAILDDGTRGVACVKDKSDFDSPRLRPMAKLMIKILVVASMMPIRTRLRLLLYSRTRNAVTSFGLPVNMIRILRKLSLSGWISVLTFSAS